MYLEDDKTDSWFLVSLVSLGKEFERKDDALASVPLFVNRDNVEDDMPVKFKMF